MKQGERLVDIFQRLMADHSAQRRLAADILNATGSFGERRVLFERLCDDLAAQNAAEEQTFGAELLACARGQAEAQRLLTAHNALAEQVLDLSELDISSCDWQSAFAQLKDTLERHLDAEESGAFPLLRAAVTAQRAEQLGERYACLKAAEAETWGSLPLANRLTPA